MTEFNCAMSSAEQMSDTMPSAYNYLHMLAGICITTCVLVKLAESHNKLKYDNFFARALAGYIKFVINLVHTTKSQLNLSDTGPRLLAIGPHKTSLEAVVVASKIEGSPPRFFATDSFNVIPGVAAFMEMFKVIAVAAKPDKAKLDGRSANEDALETASETLKNNGCVALFPQGNFAKIGEDSHRIYAGAAKLAIKSNTPIHVLRVDGFWSLQNPLIPLFIKNNMFYRAFLSALHPNNVTVTECCLIDVHLGLKAETLSSDELTEEICAQLYAFYRYTEELSIDQIGEIKEEIEAGEHLEVWRSKIHLYDMGKKIKLLENEYSAERGKHNTLEERFFKPAVNVSPLSSDALVVYQPPSL
tara:strand:+ start:169 stop:1245 length:1077 start_codon:yes stop_codon:yes gene_type:complete